MTLHDILFVHMKNDIGFLFLDQINLWEAQSGWNHNLPLRSLLQGTDEIRKERNAKGQKPSRAVRISIPLFRRCVAFYSGDRQILDETVLKLSDNMSQFPDGLMFRSE